MWHKVLAEMVEEIWNGGVGIRIVITNDGLKYSWLSNQLHLSFGAWHSIINKSTAAATY